MKSITWGQYIPGCSVLHRLDPRSKLWTAFLLILSLFVLPQLSFYALYVLLLCGLHLLAGFSPLLIPKDMKRVGLLLFFTFLMRLITTGGVPLRLGTAELPFTAEGLNIALQMTARIGLMVSTASFLSRLETPKVLADGLRKAFSFLEFLGVPMEDIGLITMLAFRFIPTLQKEIRGLMDAQRSRGVIFEEGSWLKRSRRMAALLPPLFLSLLRRSDELVTAMTIRGYTGENQPRSQFRPLRYERNDFLCYGASAVFFLAVVAVRVLG